MSSMYAVITLIGPALILIHLSLLITSKSRSKYIQFITEYLGLCLLYIIFKFIGYNSVILEFIGFILIELLLYCVWCIVCIHRDLLILYKMIEKNNGGCNNEK